MEGQPVENQEPGQLIEQFLREEDVSRSTLMVAKLLEDITPTSHQTVEQILQQWSCVQAVANVLQHPSLIEEQKRVEYLMKGLSCFKI